MMNSFLYWRGRLVRFSANSLRGNYWGKDKNLIYNIIFFQMYKLLFNSISFVCITKMIDSLSLKSMNSWEKCNLYNIDVFGVVCVLFNLLNMVSITRTDNKILCEHSILMLIAKIEEFGIRSAGNILLNKKPTDSYNNFEVTGQNR